MYDPTLSFEIDMLALESAITNLEYENGITPEYLHSPCDENEYAESATESTGILAGLFEDDFVATEGFGDTKVGKGLKVMIITIGGAIKKMFISLATKVKGFFQAQIEKFQRAKALKDPKVAAALNNGVVISLRTKVNTTFATVETTIVAASNRIKPMIQRINKVLTQAGIGNSAKTTVDKSKLNEIGEAYRNSEATRATRREIANDKSPENTFSRRYSDNSVAIDRDAADDEEIKKLNGAYETLKNIINTMNDDVKALLKDGPKIKAESTDSHGDTKVADKEKDLTAKTILLAVMMDIDLSKINKIAKAITTECSVHTKACENIVKTAGGLDNDKDNPYVKAGYNLCKKYLDCSRIFTQISLACNALFVFKASGAADAMNKKYND